MKKKRFEIDATDKYKQYVHLSLRALWSWTWPIKSFHCVQSCALLKALFKQVLPAYCIWSTICCKLFIFELPLIPSNGISKSSSLCATLQCSCYTDGKELCKNFQFFDFRTVISVHRPQNAKHPIPSLHFEGVYFFLFAFLNVQFIQEDYHHSARRFRSNVISVAALLKRSFHIQCTTYLHYICNF